MTTAAQAFAPGSPANLGAGVAEKAAAALKLGQGMTLPPISAQSSSKAGDVLATLGQTFDFSGLSVNYGSGVNQGGAVPGWVWLAAAAGAVWWIAKR